MFLSLIKRVIDSSLSFYFVASSLSLCVTMKDYKTLKQQLTLISFFSKLEYQTINNQHVQDTTHHQCLFSNYLLYSAAGVFHHCKNESL